MYTGSMVALVTPMQADGAIDYAALHTLVEWHITNQTTALIIAGTTGEGPALSSVEHAALIADVVKQVAGRIPVIAGTGSNATSHTIALTQAAEEAGADAALIVTPYYNKPSQAGLFAHYQAVASAVNLPIILYNVPGRTACDLLPETVERLAKIPRIIGIKEATGKVDRATDILQRCGTQFAIYSGDDATAYDLLMHGAQGIISVTANVAPRNMHDFCAAALAGDLALAEKLNQQLMPLHKKLFVEANPIPVKWALHRMGLIGPGIRLPLTPLDLRYHTEVKEALYAAGILSETTLSE